MRNILLFAALLFALAPVRAQTTSPSANDVLKPVYAKASKESKNVLLIFHASWCGWCRKMDSSLKDKMVQPLIDKNYVVAHLTVYESADKKDLENAGASDVLTSYGGADKGLPYWYILDKNGKLLANPEYKPGKNSGCPASEEEVAYFINVLKQTSNLLQSELQLIRKRFRLNEQ